MIRFSITHVYQLNPQKYFSKRGYWHQSLALLLFVLIGADLMLPQVCCEEWKETSDESVVRLFALDNHPLNSDTSQPDPCSDGTSNQQGCFCCCGHILQSNNFFGGILNSQLSGIEFKSPFVPSSPPHDMFHPPRST
jgi:hypothetical protein